GLELVDDAVDDVVFHRLMIGRDVVVVGAVEIGAADVERILAQRIGDVLDPALGGEHALRPAKTAKGGVGNGVGVKRLGAHPHGGVPIGVVGVKQRAVGDGAGQI